mmetsp:Transcript_144078/g.401434  ORF Transcript_144078/g.401434 Transcript_144078/m.401434 type:complete len:251 (-) Transcript_144078:314-1066(-)
MVVPTLPTHGAAVPRRRAPCIVSIAIAVLHAARSLVHFKLPPQVPHNLAQTLPTARVAPTALPKCRTNAKSPQSAWMHFASDKRVEFLGSTLSAQQIDKLLAEHWHQLSEAERAPWEGRAANDKARHKKTKGAVPAPVVKRPKNVYMHFAGSLRAELMAAGHKVTEVSILTGRKWAVLGQEERAQWEAKAAEDKERYRAELEASGAAGAGATPQAAGRRSEPAPRTTGTSRSRCPCSSGRWGSARERRTP